MGGELTVLAAILAPLANAPAVPAAFDGIPAVTIAYYDVSGRNAAAIRRAIDKARPANPSEPGKSYDGRTDWAMRWHWKGDGSGGCDLASAELIYSARVVLPRLTGEVSASVQRQWDRYIAALAEHEAGHARIAYDHRDRVIAAIKGATCSTADAAAKAALATLGEEDRAYDRKTRHGATQGALFPQ